MSSDTIAVVLLAGFVVATIAVDDWLRNRERRRLERHDRESHDRLMRELQRQP